MKIFVRFGLENLPNNYYEFNDVSDIKVDNGYLTFRYFGQRLQAYNIAYFPYNNTWFGVIGEKKVEKPKKEEPKKK